MNRTLSTSWLILSLVLLLLPGTLLGWAASRADDEHSRLLLLLGAAFEFLFGFWLTRRPEAWKPPMGAPVIGLYLIGLSWFWLCNANTQHWFPNLVQAILLLVPLVLFFFQMIDSIGAADQRRARLLIERLSYRKDWPPRLADCKLLPEVKALRDAIHADATAVILQLNHPRVEVRLALLGALEFRKGWRRGQAERVLELARNDSEPAVRAAAMMALANVEREAVLLDMTAFLRDPAAEVRHAAAEALLWEVEARWNLLREGFKNGLADPKAAQDGPLPCTGGRLPPFAVSDLIGWSVESGPLGQRASQTLIAHFNRMLNEEPSPELIEDLHIRLVDPKTSSTLRFELTQLLSEHRLLTAELLQEMLQPEYPGSVRLLAAEQMLRHHAATHTEQAVETLRQLARQPNRELALATAEVVQRCLHLNFGLPKDQSLPPPNSPLAAEVTRQLLQWGRQKPEPADPQAEKVTPLRPELPRAESPPPPRAESPPPPRADAAPPVGKGSNGWRWTR